ncbi:MAG: succinylglutamate desuccinylase/aspartoacylase family protein [Acidobacteria bacterium]|nr:succinylglutamate desuccinylase/aspartoacylase family protein [Acidobacteriota bacterium]
MSTLLVEPHSIDFNRPGTTHYQVQFHLDGAWGYSLVPLTVINGTLGDTFLHKPNGVLVFGGTHGNEYEGQIAVKRLCRDLDPASLHGRVILMPQLSESACRANQRVSPFDNINMNRAFPGNPHGTLSSRIAHFVSSQIFPLGRVVIDVHSGGREGAFPLCTSFHPIPDPAQAAEIETVARLFDTPFLFIYASTMGSGLLTDHAEALGKISIGGEFGSGETADPVGIRHAYEGIRNVLRHYQLLPEPVQDIRPLGSPPPRLVSATELSAYVPCPRDGVWEPLVDLGAPVAAGDLLGRLHDFSDHAEAPLEIRANRSGYLLMTHRSARPLKGQTLYVIAEETTL